MPMVREKENELSNMKCAKAMPGSKPYRITDRGGLHLLVTPAGGKLWRWRYYFEGKEKLMAFGKYPDISLADARVLHAKARVLLATGINPMAVRKEAKEVKKAECAEEEKTATDCFEYLVRKWFAWWKADKNQKYAANVEARLENDVIAQIGKKRPDEIKRMDIVALCQDVDARGARDIARRNLQIIRQIFDWGLNNGFLDENGTNPAASIQPNQILSRVIQKNFAHLNINDVPELLAKMRNYNGNVLTRLAMELLSLTFIRTGELIGGRWEEIDWKQNLWVIPAERMKMKREHIVPLSSQALAVLKRLQTVSGNTDRLFPDYNGGTGIMSNNTILKALDRMGYKGRMTGHGWRHIASTYLNEQGFDPTHVEMQLSHIGKGEVAAVYNKAKYLAARTKMMQHWADFLDKCRHESEYGVHLVA